MTARLDPLAEAQLYQRKLARIDATAERKLAALDARADTVREEARKATESLRASLSPEASAVLAALGGEK